MTQLLAVVIYYPKSQKKQIREKQYFIFEVQNDNLNALDSSELKWYDRYQKIIDLDHLH